MYESIGRLSAKLICTVFILISSSFSSVFNFIVYNNFYVESRETSLHFVGACVPKCRLRSDRALWAHALRARFSISCFLFPVPIVCKQSSVNK